MKIMKNKCNYIRRKSKIKYLKRSTEKGISSSKQFWNFVKLFLENKGCMGNDVISITNGDAFIDKESVLMEILNTHYINIVEKTLGVAPGNYFTVTNNTQEINEETISTHSSILKIQRNLDSSFTFGFPKAEVADVNALLNQRDPKKQLDLTQFPHI